jgi:hypothetical protein
MRPLGVTCQLGFCPLGRNRRRICFRLIGHTGRRSEFDCMDAGGVGQMRGSYHRSRRGGGVLRNAQALMGGVKVVLFQNGPGRYFRVGPESNCIDVGLAEDQASCCGVNLAFAGFGVWFFLRDLARSSKVQGLRLEKGY